MYQHNRFKPKQNIYCKEDTKLIKRTPQLRDTINKPNPKKEFTSQQAAICLDEKVAHTIFMCQANFKIIKKLALRDREINTKHEIYFLLSRNDNFLKQTQQTQRTICQVRMNGSERCRLNNMAQLFKEQVVVVLGFSDS